MEDKIGIVIQARTGSTRMPQKVIQPFHGSRGILELISERIRDSFSATPICIATSSEPPDDAIEEIANKLEINCFRGSENNVLDRFIQATEQLGSTKVIRICADNPFLDMESLQLLRSKLETSAADYVSFQFSNGTPSILSHLGLFAEGVKLTALREAAALTQDPYYTEHVTNYLYKNTEKFTVEWIPVQSTYDDTEKVRLTLDTQHDFNLLKELYSKFVLELDFDTPNLIKFTKSREDILERMSQEIKANSK